ncbi:MAG: response regulator [Burkholderiales bacterium]|jgi:CheY-like chemotaxis protein|nr:response regulator [Burkholderiales bacterium]
MSQQRIFVKVTGFSDVERHALNTVFRLSEGREVVYALWTPGAPDEPRVALVDGQSYEAGVELTATGAAAGPRLIWVGAIAPAHAWLTFERPMRWSDVVRAMDEAFMPPPPLDLDLDAPPELDLDLSVFDVAKPAGDARRALVIAVDMELRLYLRAKLAAVGLTRLQEATSASDAMEFGQTEKFDLILLDLDLTGADDWQLYRGVRLLQPEASMVLLTRQRGLGTRLKAWWLGATACLRKPLSPTALQEAITRVPKSRRQALPPPDPQ